MKTTTKPICVSVMLPPDEWQDLRLLAIARRCSASAIVRSLVSGHLCHSSHEVKRVKATKPERVGA